MRNTRRAPDFLRGERPLELDTDVRRLQGLGISEGRIEGVVRILATPEDGHRLHSGDILVARSVDPGWTPLFSIAGGLILELGGRLSHGAVVAREYGLPGWFKLKALRNDSQMGRPFYWMDNRELFGSGIRGLRSGYREFVGRVRDRCPAPQ